MKYFYSFLLATICTLPLAAKAQQDSLKLREILDKTKRLSDEQPVEKVYLHFDKPYYAVADTMWFKGYVVTEQHVPSPLSKVLYVEFFTEKDSLVKSLRLPVKDGIAYGNLPIAMNEFVQGNYYVRAYTLWMLNFDAEFYFYKNIPIGEAIDKRLLTNISFNNAESNQDIKTTARIQFKDLSKKPFANRTVNWQIYNDYDEYAKGKTTTDANGFATITVSSKNGKLLKNGNIVANITVSEKETVPVSFGLHQSLSNIDFQLFAEGGNLLLGIPNQVAFKAVKNDGLSIGVKGTIVDEQGAEVAQFQSGFAGMGSFYLTPQPNKTYKAVAKFDNGTSKTIDLPTVQNKGLALQMVNATPDFINLRIIPTANFLNENKEKAFSIVGINSNVVYYAGQALLKGDIITVKVPTKNFPSGVAQFTVFDDQNKPLTQRLAFVLHQDELKLAIKSDLPSYKSRQKVKLTLNASTFGQPAQGDLSVAVVDEQKVPADENAETTILSSLLLTSDIKGYVEKPNYYFTKTDDKKLASLDKLLLTQGYSRFNYADIIQNKYPQISLLPEQGITISGSLRDQTGMPIKKGAMRLVVKDKPVSAETITSNMGLFRFQNLNLPDSSTVTITSHVATVPNTMILLDGSVMAGKTNNPNALDNVVNIDTSLASYLNNSAKQYRFLRTLKGVEVKAAARKKVNHTDFASLSSLSNIVDHEIDGEYFQGCNLLLECLKVRATGLTYDQDQQKFFVSRDYNAGKRVPVQIFLNGMPIDAQNINATLPSEVDNVEIYLRDELGTINRMYNTNGVLAIYTKKKPKGEKISRQQLMDMLPKKNLITLSPQGYAKNRDFYSPKYLPGKVYNNTDLRTTVYWNPKVITDAQGNSTIEFYNADGKGTYKVVVEGLDRDGNVGRAVYRYSVK